MSTLEILVPFVAYAFIVLVGAGLCRAADKPEPRPPELDKAPR